MREGQKNVILLFLVYVLVCVCVFLPFLLLAAIDCLVRRLRAARVYVNNETSREGGQQPNDGVSDKRHLRARVASSFGVSTGARRRAPTLPRLPSVDTHTVVRLQIDRAYRPPTHSMDGSRPIQRTAAPAAPPDAADPAAAAAWAAAVAQSQLWANPYGAMAAPYMHAYAQALAAASGGVGAGVAGAMRAPHAPRKEKSSGSGISTVTVSVVGRVRDWHEGAGTKKGAQTSKKGFGPDPLFRERVAASGDVR